jgi:tetratricopeptide (TPR) repeat protein
LIQICKANSSDFLSSKNGEDQQNKTTEYANAKEYFRRAKIVLEERLKKGQNLNTLVELGNLYFEMERHNEAKEYFIEALKISSSHVLALIGLGNVYMFEENYKEAISKYSEAVKLEPDNLEFKSNLAEAYLKSGKIEMAEKHYCEILDRAPGHMDSLIGISQTYIAMGENAKDKKDYENADVMFSTAEDYFCKTIAYIQNPGNASKILNRNEKSAVFYSKGYNEAMIYELQQRQDPKKLETALRDFRKVELETSNYFKAQRAIKTIVGKLNPPEGTINKWGSRLVVFFSIIVFIVAQLLFVFGKPIWSNNGFVIDSDIFEDTAKSVLASLDPSIVNTLKLKAQQNQVFNSTGDFFHLIDNEFGDSISASLKGVALLRGSNSITIKSFEALDTGYYVLITFGCLLFMIAGLYLSQLSKLKVGAIELEKSSIDQITTSSSLGIIK